MNVKSEWELIRGAVRVDRTSSVPLSHQVERRLAELIQEGRLRPGDQLPHETEWSEELGINRSTLRIALGRLTENGLIYRRKRAGTFVADSVGRDNNIGYFYFREASDVLAESLHHVQELLESRGYDLKVVAFPFDYYEEVDLVAEMTRRSLRGTVLVEMPTPGCLTQLRRLEELNFPYVRVGNKFFIGQLRAPLVTGDNRQGVRDAFDTLHRLGHRKIGYISHMSGWGAHRAYRERCRKLAGYKSSWLTKVFYRNANDGWARFDPYPPLREYLVRHPELTAVMTDSCRFCEPFMRIARELDRGVPEKMSLISLDDKADVDTSEFPDVTYMRVSRIDQSEQAVENLLHVIENGLPRRERVTRIPFELIEGGSVASPPPFLSRLQSPFRGV